MRNEEEEERQFKAGFDAEPEADESFIEGMRCPSCGKAEAFKIAVSQVVLVYPDWIDDGDTGGHEWEDDSYCECNECAHTGTVKDFQAEPEEGTADE